MVMARQGLTNPPDSLGDKEKERVRVWCKENFPYKYKQLGSLWSECQDWHLSTGTQRVNWEATFRNWIRRSAQFDKDKKRKDNNPYWNETPQESRGSKSSELVPILDLIKGDKK